MIPVLCAVGAGVGVHLLFGALAHGRRALFNRPVDPQRAPLGRNVADWLAQAGLAGVRPTEFLAVVGVLAAVGGALAFALFGGFLTTAVVAAGCATAPLGWYRNRRLSRLEQAQSAWPRLIEEIRINATSLGRSIPQALFDVIPSAPPELRPAFRAAQREWLITTDFGRTLDVLRSRLADPTADAACETLLIAHEVGGTDVGRRLAALAEDRRIDVNARKDARARQAGVRFARRFVVIVPIGMALAGTMIGSGRAAYNTAAGQLVVILAAGLLVGCWVWAGRFLRIPEPERVFADPVATPRRPGR